MVSLGFVLHHRPRRMRSNMKSKLNMPTKLNKAPKSRENLGFNQTRPLLILARRMRKILRFLGAFWGRKHIKNALRKVFLIQKHFQTASKFSACGGHIIIEIRLVCPYFFRFWAEKFPSWESAGKLSSGLKSVENRILHTHRF